MITARQWALNLVLRADEPKIERKSLRLDLHGAFAGEVRPDTPRPFALLSPNDRAHPSFSAAIEMQRQVFARAFCVSEMFEVYDSPIRQAQQVHGQC